MFRGLKTTLWALAFTTGFALSASSWASPSSFPSVYDRPIKAAVELWWPGEPWKLWKAQLYQESRLNPLARSPVGAEGLAQFMPATWAEVSKAMKWGLVDRRLAEPAIEGGAYYMMTLRRQWASRDTMHQFAQASYNAGAGNIRRAWRLCKQPESWELTTECLPQITGKHATETINYVRLIDKWHKRMELE